MLEVARLFCLSFSWWQDRSWLRSRVCWGGKARPSSRAWWHSLASHFSCLEATELYERKALTSGDLRCTKSFQIQVRNFWVSDE